MDSKPHAAGRQHRKHRYQKRARFWLSLASTVAQVAAIVIIAFWLLPAAGIRLEWWAVALFCAALVAWDAFTYIMGTRALDRQPVSDFESMIGLTGVAITRLAPGGSIRARGELWDAVSLDGELDKGTRIVVVEHEGSTLKVRRATR